LIIYPAIRAKAITLAVHGNAMIMAESQKTTSPKMLAADAEHSTTFPQRHVKMVMASGRAIPQMLTKTHSHALATRTTNVVVAI
jgi:hypothetical protein